MTTEPVMVPNGRPGTGGRTFVPEPGRAPLGRMIAAQTAMEARLTLRHGESLVLTMVIPILLLVGISQTSVVRLPGDDRVGFLAPGILALAVMSSAFTGQAISTGFERSYGVLKRLGASALSRRDLLLAKTLAVLAVITLQMVVIAAVAVLLGWRPAVSGIPAAAGLVLLGTAAFSGLGLLMAGTLRAEATLAAANLVYLLLLAVGGVMYALPSGVSGVLGLLPITALVDGLRAVLSDGGTGPLRCWVVLGVWAVASITAAARWFRWE
ncbi:MAG TPA: ABC transporter permease [Mycobacteriales bacterium]|jgi:ABC-2 type transport system permease protein|nr:ABC transporter permease [Mycobacteriales bacterium]